MMPHGAPGELDAVHIMLMVDATNGFNELGRKAMRWMVRLYHMGLGRSVCI